MRIYDLAYLAVRVLAIWLFVSGLNQAVSLLNGSLPIFVKTFELYEIYPGMALVGIAPIALLIAGSVVMWMMTKRLAGWLVPRGARKDAAAADSEFGAGGDAEASHAVRLKDMEGFVLAVIGLILFIVSFAGFVRLGLISIYYESGDYVFVRNSNLSSLVELGIRCVVGIMLMVKAEGFALALRKIRAIGLPRLPR